MLMRRKVSLLEAEWKNKYRKFSLKLCEEFLNKLQMKKKVCVRNI